MALLRPQLLKTRLCTRSDTQYACRLVTGRDNQLQKGVRQSKHRFYPR